MMVPPGEKPFEVGWEIIQGDTLVKRVPFGSYRIPNVFYELVHVESDSTFTFFMDIQNSNFGRGKSKLKNNV